MPRPKRYPSPGETRYVTLGQIAEATGLSQTKARKILTENQWWMGMPRRSKWNADVIEMIRSVLGQPAKSLTPPGQDWLSQHLGKDPDA